MASNLRVDSIVPATGTNVAIGTAGGGVNIPGVLTYEDVTNVDSVGIITARSGIRVGANGTKRETVHLDVGDSGANYLRFTNTTTGNGAADGFNVGINADENALLWNFENKNTIFATNNLERFRITSAGKVAIGTSLIGHDDADNLTIDGSGEGTGRAGITIRSATNTFGSIFFSDATSGNAQYDGVIAYQHDTQQMRFSTAETQRMFIDSTGKVTKPFQPFFKAQPSTAQNITSGSGVVNYQTEIHDVGGIYNASTSTFTAPIGGTYLITWNYFCIPTNNFARANLHKSTDGGSSFPFLQRGDRVGKSSDIYEATTNVAMVPLNANDQLRIQFEEGQLHVNTGYNYFQGYLLG